MTHAQRLEALKRLSAAKLAARCPVKPIMPPPRFDWNRRWPQFMAGYKGQTVAQFIASDDRRDTFKEPIYADTVQEYVKRWDEARNLKPAMDFITPTLGNYA